MSKSASLSFTVLGAPIPGARARVFTRKNGTVGAAIPAKNKAYQKKVATCAWAAALNQRWQIPSKEVGLSIEIKVYREIRKGDASNYVKIVEDGINDSKSIWIDDRLVSKIEVEIFELPKDRLSEVARIEVVVSIRP